MSQSPGGPGCLLWAKQAPDTGGQRASAGCCQLGRLSAAERCLSKQTRPYGACHYRPSVARHPAQCGGTGTRVHTQTASHRGTAIPAGMLWKRALRSRATETDQHDKGDMLQRLLTNQFNTG
ncbi:unnamed protein product [Arctogadus glacialis]